MAIWQEWKMKASQNDTAEFTKRTLMALTDALADYKERGQQIEAMIMALAGAYDLPSVLPDPAG
ncbi:hypothetical protein [Bradyrhizobium sp. RDM4]|uniref:hypothetical protein n=1 Tax=Bradyrhizobium sp. RDM4 TaxID=3378765 RepID=UPI0038FCCBF2